MKKPTFNKMRSRLFLSILISVITFVGFGCNDDISDPSHAISGTVIDSLTKAPIDSAWVIRHDTTAFTPTYTDSLGYYVTEWIGGVSNTWLYVGKPGYKTKSRYLTEIKTEITRGIDFELVRDTL